MPESLYKVVLPVLSKTSQPDLNCIAPHTLIDLICGKFDGHYDEILIIGPSLLSLCF